MARTAPQCAEEMLAPAPTASAYGINVNVLHRLAYDDTTPDASYRSVATLLREANLGWVRMDFSWGALIAFDSYKRDTSLIDWSAMDADVDRAVCRGLNVLGILEYTPAWAVNRFPDGGTVSRQSAGVAPGDSVSTMSTRNYAPLDFRERVLPDSIQKWEEFVRAAVTRYPDIKYWSIWNEPNSPNFFRGNDPYDGAGRLDNLVPAYDTLVAHAAPWIRNNPDGRGRRYLVAPELAGTNNDAKSDEFLRRVVQAQGQNIDVVAVHTYGTAADIIKYMRYLHSSGPLSAWSGEVWLTEAGTTGCNDSPGTRPSYCGGTGNGTVTSMIRIWRVT